jgi:hypothetical protein
MEYYKRKQGGNIPAAFPKYVTDPTREAQILAELLTSNSQVPSNLT